MSKFLSLLFGHVEKRLDQNDKIDFSIYDVQPGKQRLQYTYCPISQEVKAIRQ